MKFAIYGVSRSGKDYFIDALVQYFSANGATLYHVKGSETLNYMALETYGIKFSQCDDTKKRDLRERFTERINELESKHENVVVDGHYAFFDDQKTLFSVCTQSDIDCYDQFFYLDSEPKQIIDRMRNSSGSKYNDRLTEADIQHWQDYEIERFTEELLKQDKELHIIRYENENALQYVFDCATKDKYNSKIIARRMVEALQINSECVILTDCDKTLSVEDSAELALDYSNQPKTELKEIFQNDRYSNYQMVQANKYFNETALFTEDSMKYVVQKIRANQNLIDDLLEIHEIPIVGITAGKGVLWNYILQKFDFKIPVLAQEEMLVSKYVKYFVVKELQSRGKYVIAIGDSLLDGLMLKQANKSYIVTAKGYRESIEKFLAQNQAIKQLDYFPICYLNGAHEKTISPIKSLTENEQISAHIAVCKSDSAITGKKLRESHYALGKEVAKMIQSDFANVQFAVVAVMRAGLPFSLGIADYFDCPILFHDDNSLISLNQQLSENIQLQGKTLIVCDAVINSGMTIENLIISLKNQKCIIATNVLSDKFSKRLKCPIYVGRISMHSFIGARQKIIAHGKGPDTGDRLFNLLQ